AGHGNNLFIGERKRSEPALPTRSPMDEGAEEIDTFTIHRRAQAAGVPTRSWRLAHQSAHCQLQNAVKVDQIAGRWVLQTGRTTPARERGFRDVRDERAP